MSTLENIKSTNKNLIFILSIIFFSFFAKFIIITFYAGHADIYNALSFMEYFDNGQDVTGMPYSPFSYIFPYYSSYLLKYISIDYFVSLRIFTFFSEIFLFFSLRGLTFLDDKRLSLLVFFNPFLLLYSGIHGQIDIWAISFAFLSLKKNNNFEEFFRGFYLAMSCLIKPLFIPLILIFFLKNNKINFEFLISFGLVFLIPFFMVNIEYISLLNLFLIINKFSVSEFDINFFYNFPSIIETILILIFIFSLILIKKNMLAIILFLPMIILIKGAFNLQYIAWLIPLFIFNYKLGFFTSLFFSILYIFFILNSYNSTELFLNSSALSLNNNIFGNNFISFSKSNEFIKLLEKLIIFFSFILIAINVIFFYKNYREK